NPTTGTIFLVYEDSTFRSDQLPQIGLRFSTDAGLSWSASIMVNRTPQNSPNPQAFTPTVAVNGDGVVIVTYGDLRFDDKQNPDTDTKAMMWAAQYQEISGGLGSGSGLEFVGEVALSPAPFIVQQGPSTTQGVMTEGDYIS